MKGLKATIYEVTFQEHSCSTINPLKVHFNQ